MTPPALVARDLTVVRDGRPLVDRLQLEVAPGEFVVLAGPSGVGKTSLLSCVAGLLAPASGRVEFPTGVARGRLGMVFQHLLLTPNATAETNALCGLLGTRRWWATLAGFPRADRERARRWLERLEIGASGDTPVRRLSGGERQRVAIARALLPGPSVLLADEPVSHLDPALARRVLEVLKAEARATACAVLCVLHDAALTAEFADRVLTLRREAPSDWEVSAP